MKFDLEDAQSEILDHAKSAELIREHLENATSCETAKDFRANLAEALEEARELVRELEQLTKESGQ